MNALRLVADLLVTAIRPARCGFGCGFTSRYGGRMVAHYYTDHAGDRLAEEGRRLASEREDLIARGVDPADLQIPRYPEGH